jgi:hypothetical protein
MGIVHILGTGMEITIESKKFSVQEINYFRSKSYFELEIEPREKTGLQIIKPILIDTNNNIEPNKKNVLTIFNKNENFAFPALLLTFLFLLTLVYKKLKKQ